MKPLAKYKAPAPNTIYVVFEGIDGSGKTEQSKMLMGRLAALNYDVQWCKEPTDGSFGRELRRSMREGRLSMNEELELFEADRRDHMTQFVSPLLAVPGTIVISDRSFWSTVVYQGVRGFDQKALLARQRQIARKPDAVVYLNCAPRVAAARLGASRGADTFEGIDNLVACHTLYTQLAFQSDWVTFDAQQPLDIIHEQIWGWFQDAFKVRLRRPAL